MPKVLQFGDVLLGRLKFAKKFMVIFMIFILSLGSIGTLYIDSLQKKEKFVASEQKGMTYIELMLHTMFNLQKHRQYTMIYLGGDTSVEKEINEISKQIHKQVKQINTLQKNEKDIFAIAEAWTSHISAWEKISSGWRTFTTGENMKRHNALINDMLSTILLVSDRSKLTLDSDINNSYLVRLVVDKIPYISELVGSTQAYASELTFQNQIEESERTQLTYYLNSLSNATSTLKSVTESLFRGSEALQEKYKQYTGLVISEISNISSKIDWRLLRNTGAMITAKELYSETNEAQAALYELTLFSVKMLKDRIDEQHDALQVTIWSTVVAIGVVLAIVFYLLIVFYKSMKSNIHLIESVTAQAAKGDLTVHMLVSTKDEFAQIASSFNKLIGSFRSIIAVNQQLVEELSASSQELTAITEETMQATDQVSATVQEVAEGAGKQLDSAQKNTRSLKSLMNDTHYISERAQTVAKSSLQMTEEAKKGTVSIHAMIGQMDNVNHLVSQSTSIIQTLHERSNSIGQMAQSITAIAEQTNLLALNAAIEAARAGDHGKGFTVVANEVRKLAEESSKSAKQIHRLLSEIKEDTSKSVTSMEKVLKETQKGVAVANDTSQIFQVIMASTQDVSEQIKDVSSCLLGMEASLREIVALIHDTEQISRESEQQTSIVAAASEQLLASMEEISAAVQSLNNKSQELYRTVEQFNI